MVSKRKIGGTSKSSLGEADRIIEKACEEFDRLYDIATVVPDGWVRASDIAKAKNISVAAVTSRLNEAVGQGKAEKKKFLVKTEGVVRWVTYFKLGNG